MHGDADAAKIVSDFKWATTNQGPNPQGQVQPSSEQQPAMVLKSRVVAKPKHFAFITEFAQHRGCPFDEAQALVQGAINGEPEAAPNPSSHHHPWCS